MTVTIGVDDVTGEIIIEETEEWDEMCLDWEE
jgi:hypothetical protein